MSNVQHASEPSGSMDQMQQPMQFQQLQQMVFSLVQQVQQHQTLFEELQTLKNEILGLKTENQALVNENNQLRAQLSAATARSPPQDVASPAQEKNGARSFAAIAAAAVKKDSRPSRPAAVSLKKRIAAARAFKTLEAQGPQGFTYVYLGRSRKLDRTEVRSRLRRAGVDTGRVLDVCFPATGVLGVLIHTQYVEKFTELMTTAEAEFIKDFDPLNPAHLADPKYASLSANARENEMANLVHSRCISTLAFIRPVMVPSVGRSFVELGWIDDGDLDQAIKEARSRLAEKDPKKAAFAFRSSGALPSGEDVTGDSDTEMSQ
jgi:regulator of replication initiation timing